MSETTAIAVLGERALVPAEVFKPGGVRIILDQIKAEVARVRIDGSTPEGREECRSLAHKVTRSKTALDKMGKDLTEQWRVRTNAVNEERRLIREELEELHDRVRKPLDEWEAREANRVQAHKDALNTLERLCDFDEEITVDAIDERLVQASTFVTTRPWDEFQDRASDLFARVNDALNDLRATVIREQKEQAEAARLQAEREEQARLQAVREQEAREARIAEEAAQRARQEAEDRAQREAAEAAQKAEAARLRAIREEQDRHADELEAMHQAQIERDKLAAREAEKEARRREDAARVAEVAKLQAEYQAKREAQAKEWQANAKKQAAEAAEAAATAERQLIAEQAEMERKAAAAREADKKHHSAVNRAARDAIVLVIGTANLDDLGSEKIATAIVVAIAKGEIPHVKVIY